MAKAEKDIKPIIKSYFTIIPRQDAVREWEFEEIHIDPVIELNGFEEDSLQSQTVLKAVTKLIDRVAKDETKELPQRIGVTYTMNPQKKRLLSTYSRDAKNLHRQESCAIIFPL